MIWNQNKTKLETRSDCDLLGRIWESPRGARFRSPTSAAHNSLANMGDHLLERHPAHLNYHSHKSHELAAVTPMPLMLLMQHFFHFSILRFCFPTVNIFEKLLTTGWELGLGLGLGRTKNTTKTFSAVKKRDLSCRSIPLSSLLPTWCGNSL